MTPTYSRITYKSRTGEIHIIDRVPRLALSATLAALAPASEILSITSTVFEDLVDGSANAGQQRI
jgi:hypothetical protein